MWAPLVSHTVRITAPPVPTTFVLQPPPLCRALGLTAPGRHARHPFPTTSVGCKREQTPLWSTFFLLHLLPPLCRCASRHQAAVDSYLWPSSGQPTDSPRTARQLTPSLTCPSPSSPRLSRLRPALVQPE
jgi:hypothetical protein